MRFSGIVLFAFLISQDANPLVGTSWEGRNPDMTRSAHSLDFVQDSSFLADPELAKYWGSYSGFTPSRGGYYGTYCVDADTVWLFEEFYLLGYENTVKYRAGPEEKFWKNNDTLVRIPIPGQPQGESADLYIRVKN